MASQVGMLLRLVTGVWLFRLFYHQLSREDFGFYTLLWSLLGYSLFLDFGLGYTAQKITAEKMATGDVGGLNRYLSTAYWALALIGGVVFVVAVLTAPIVLRSVRTPADHWHEFYLAYLVFLGAVGLSFPLGFLSEILAGLQRTDLCNYVTIVSILVNVTCLTWGIDHHWQLPALVFAAVSLNWIGPSAFHYVLIRAHVPGFSLSPRHVDRHALTEEVHFSRNVYVNSCAHFVMTRTDQVVISLTVGVAQLYAYQAGYKIADLFKGICLRAVSALTPAAAQNQAGEGHHRAQRDLLTGAFRLTLLVVPMAVFLALNVDVVLQILVGSRVEGISRVVAWFLVTSVVSSLFTDACALPVLIMGGYSGQVALIQTLAAIANIALSVVLVYRIGLPGVALGTMIPTVLFGWFGIIPLAVRFCGDGFVPVVREILQPVWKPLGVSFALAAATSTIHVTGSGAIPVFLGSALLVAFPLGPTAIRVGRRLVVLAPSEEALPLPCSEEVDALACLSSAEAEAALS